MVKQAKQVKAGEFVNVGDSYLGQVTEVTLDTDTGVVRMKHACGDYEMDGTAHVDAWDTLPKVDCRLPCCIRIEVSRHPQRAGHTWQTLHNGRLLDRGWSAGSYNETRQFAKNMLEAMGLLQDGC